MKPLPARWSARATAALLAASLAAGCDRLLVDAAPGPADARVSLSIELQQAPAGSVPLDAADHIRVQFSRGQEILLDTVLPFSPSRTDLVMPVRRAGQGGAVTLKVELREAYRPLLQGATTVSIRPQRWTDAEVLLAPAAVTPLAPVVALSAGLYHSCGLQDGGQAYCWGSNDAGQIGDGTMLPRPVPGPVALAGVPLGSIGTGYQDSCGLASDGQVYCWGSEGYGALGREGGSAPAPVAGSLRFTSLSVGGLHACALTSGGQAYCWGLNRFGQLGDGSTTDRAAPTAVQSALRFASLSAGYAHTCGLATDGGLYCWGSNERGQVGDGTTTDRSTPTPVSGGILFQSVSAGGLHTCAVTDGIVYCWGANDYGQLGLGSEGGDHPAPERVPGATLQQVWAGGLHTCGLDGQGRAYCWGYNRSGALGDGTMESSAEPRAVAAPGSFVALATGLHHTCGLEPDGQVLCWGFNRFGQVGDGSLTSRATPAEVLASSSFFLEASVGSGALAQAVGELLDGRVAP